MSKRKILFRADASTEIGYGHFIRTLALADMLKEEYECVFYTQVPTDYQRKECAKVCQLFALPSDDSRLAEFLDILCGNEIVVLDNYFYTTDYQKAVKSKGCKLVCIDDMHDKHYVADIVINHGDVTATDFDIEPYTRLCLGDGYKLLRAPFLRPLSGEKRSNRLVLNFGGSDPMRLTDKVVSMLSEIGCERPVVAIVGDGTKITADTIRKAEIRKNLSAEELAELFETSYAGIFTVSTVAIEALSRGVPVLAGYVVDNQRDGFKKLSSERKIVPLGDLNNIDRKKIEEALNRLSCFAPYILDTQHIKENFIKVFATL